MRKLLFVFTVLGSLLISSCSDNAFQEMLFRTTEDPFQDVPVTDSLTKEHTVYLSWKEDEGCDTFRLMRSYDQPDLYFTCIYEGTATEYTDENLPDGDKYVYRLDKTRGRKKDFVGNAYAYGYSSDCRRDIWEDNDTEDKAIRLEHDLICNLPCVQYITDSKEDLDCDWFYVEIPPRRMAGILVKQEGLSQGTPTNLMIQVSGETSQQIEHGIEVAISNSTDEKRNYYFRIFPRTTGLFDTDMMTDIGYTVSLRRIIIYTN
ncbi:MAG: hypothetical protein J6Y69_08790 [Treponema sp.]|nr:hypothetical protein [Treponema sp.]